MEGTKPLNLSKLWQSLHNKLRSQRTYIFPTKLGFYYAFLSFVVLGVAFIYNNNAAYFSCFMLISLGIIAIFQTNFNMDRVRFHLLPLSDVHAEHPASLGVLIENKSTQPVFQLSFKLRNSDQVIEVAHIAPKESIEISFTTVFPHRGYHLPPIIAGETRFPLGLLRSWKLFRPTESALVFPAKKGTLTLPFTGTEGQSDLENKMKAPERGQDFLGHRPYQMSDSLRQIDWKAYARNQKLNVKLFENEDKGTQLLAWNSTSAAADIETRLSQLAQWIGVCQRQKLNFVLELPHWRSRAYHSSKHIAECLTQLATYNLSEIHAKPPSVTQLFTKLAPNAIISRMRPS